MSSSEQPGAIVTPECEPCSGGNSAGGMCAGGYAGFPNPKSQPIPPAASCLSISAKVSVPGSLSKVVEELKPGDEVLGIDCEGEQAIQKVRNVKKFKADCFRIYFDQRTIECSMGHVFIQPGVSEKLASEIVIGDTLLGALGERFLVVAIESVGEKDVVAIEVHPNNMFIAEGIVHHNKACFAVVDWPP